MALNDSITLDRSARCEGEIVTIQGLAKSLLQQLTSTIDRMNHRFDDSDSQNIDWTGIREDYGVPLGKEQTVFDMCNGMLGALTGTMQNDQAVNLVNRLTV